MSNSSVATTAAYIPPPVPQTGGWHTKLTYGKGSNMPDIDDEEEIKLEHLRELQKKLLNAEKRNEKMQ